MHRILAAHSLVDCFEFIVSGYDVHQQKSHPDDYLLALRKLGLEQCQAIAIEDNLTGIQAAIMAKLTCLGIRNGYTQPLSLTRATRAFEHLGGACDWIFNRLA